MAFFNGVPRLKFDQKRMFTTWDKIMGQIVRAAAAKWLRAVLKSSIPVETGMAKAALQPLGRVVHVAISIRPSREPYYSKLEGGIQSPETGAEAMEFLIRDDKSNPLSFLYAFEWSTTILHYWTTKFYNGKATNGQAAIAAGDEAFKEHVRTTIKRRLPNAAQFLTISTSRG